MTKSDLIVSLVRAGAVGDKTMLRTTVEALMADERAKSHHTLADRLQRAIQTVAVTPPALSANSPAQSNGRDTILELTPHQRFGADSSRSHGRQSAHRRAHAVGRTTCAWL